jgi:hypothetical protein
MGWLIVVFIANVGSSIDKKMDYQNQELKACRSEIRFSCKSHSLRKTNSQRIADPGLGLIQSYSRVLNIKLI